jgi:hypothetical protein
MVRQSTGPRSNRATMRGVWRGNVVEAAASIASDGHMIFRARYAVDHELLERLRKPRKIGGDYNRPPSPGHVARAILTGGNQHRRALRLKVVNIADHWDSKTTWLGADARAWAHRVPTAQLALMARLLNFTAIRLEDVAAGRPAVVRLYRSGHLVGGIAILAGAVEWSQLSASAVGAWDKHVSGNWRHGAPVGK